MRNQLSAFYSQPESNNPQLTFSVTNSQLANNIGIERVEASNELNAWQAELQALSPTVASGTLDTALQNGVAHLAVIKNLVIDSATAVVDGVNLPAATATAYKTSITAALTDVNTAVTNVTAVIQNVASEKAAISQVQAALAVTLAGSTQNNIDAQQAQVEQAQANLQSIQVQISQASLVSHQRRHHGTERQGRADRDAGHSRRLHHLGRQP